MKTDLIKNAYQKLNNGSFEDSLDIFRELALSQSSSNYKGNLLYLLKRLNKEDRKTRSVVFVTAGIKGPTLGGGIATCFYNMIKNLSVLPDIKIYILYAAHPYYGSKNHQGWIDYFKLTYNVEFLTIDSNNNNYGSKDMKRSDVIKDYLLRLDGVFDKIVFHDFYGLAYYSLLARKHGLGLQESEIIISAHGNHALSYFFGSKKSSDWSEEASMFMEKESYQMADVVTTPSKYYADWLNDRFQLKNIIHMENIIYKDNARVVDIDVQPEDGRVNILFYGRVERLKGIDTLLTAIKKINNNHVLVNLIIIGNKSKIDDLDSDDYILSKLKESDINVYFKFNSNPSSFYEFVEKYKGIVVFPTEGETSSCVVVEAIMHNARFIASDIPGIKELISPEDHNDFLFSAGNAESLSLAIINAINNPVGKTARLSFDMSVLKGKWNSFFTSAPRKLNIKNNLSINDLVTVIIPTSDRPSLLRDSILSIKNQSYQNIEIIVFDDASKDSHLNKDICEEMSVNYIKSDMKFYKGRACNQAAEKANGVYICFFDDDDLAYPEMLSTYINAFSRDPSLDIISCYADVFEHSSVDNNGAALIEYKSLSLGNSFATNILANFFGKGTFIIKKLKFDMVGGYFEDQDPVPMVDYRFYMRSSLAGLNISIIPRGLYAYRKNSPQSLFYENRDNKRMQFLAKKGIENSIVERFGSHAGEGFKHIIWNLSLPRF